MKLQCKICESTDFSYQNDMLVCNNCGCNYSIEEAQNSLSKTPEKKHEQQTKDDFQSFKKVYIPTVIIILLAFTVFLCLSLPMPIVISNGLKYQKLADGTYKIIPSVKVKALDSTGAGDIFHGAFTYFIGIRYGVFRVLRLFNVSLARRREYARETD